MRRGNRRLSLCRGHRITRLDVGRGTGGRHRLGDRAAVTWLGPVLRTVQATSDQRDRRRAGQKSQRGENGDDAVGHGKTLRQSAGCGKMTHPKPLTSLFFSGPRRPPQEGLGRPWVYDSSLLGGSTNAISLRVFRNTMVSDTPATRSTAIRTVCEPNIGLLKLSFSSTSRSSRTSSVFTDQSVVSMSAPETVPTSAPSCDTTRLPTRSRLPMTMRRLYPIRAAAVKAPRLFSNTLPATPLTKARGGAPYMM